MAFLAESTFEVPAKYIRLGVVLATALALWIVGGLAHAKMAIQTFAVLAGAGAHDVYPASDGTVWFTAQSAGKLGRLDPRTGRSDLIALGSGAAPHGVIVGPDGAAWVTEGGQNAIARIDPATRAVKLFPLPKERRNANLNTATFGRQGVLWFTGQNGVYGRLDPRSGRMSVFDAPRGNGPYGIATTPDGQVFFASLAGNYLGQIDLETGSVTVLEPPVPRQGARRVWSDSRGALWITGWNSGDLFRYDSKDKSWARWHLPGDRPQPYAVYVDEQDAVWISDWGSNAILRFDPKAETFQSFPLPDHYANVRQLAGRKGEVWGAESGADKLFVLKAE
jgi:virginiamycin B lyase